MKQFILIFISAYVMSSSILAETSLIKEHNCLDEIKVCSEKNIVCFQAQVDYAISNPIPLVIDNTFSIVQKSKLSDDWKNNALGVLLMLKREDESLKQAEEKLVIAFKAGVESAAQNLAELYFAMDDHNSSLKYLLIVKKQGHEFPSYKYVNWARLYAQVLFLNEASKADKKRALDLFNEIKTNDDSGTSYYFMGFHEFESDNINKSLELLNLAAISGNIDALMLLGDIYATSQKINQNFELAKTYYNQAAKNNSNRAHYNLAMIYQGEKNVVKMKEHLTLAAKFGNQKAIDLFNRLNNRN
jgi:TPR repeat protein